MVSSRTSGASPSSPLSEAQLHMRERIKDDEKIESKTPGFSLRARRDRVNTILQPPETAEVPAGSESPAIMKILRRPT